MADEEEDDAPDSEKPSDEPKAAEKPKAVAKKAAAPEPAEKDDEPAKPVSKTVEWGIAIAMMVVLIGFLFMMIYLMRSARSAVM